MIITSPFTGSHFPESRFCDVRPGSCNEVPSETTDCLLSTLKAESSPCRVADKQEDAQIAAGKQPRLLLIVHKKRAKDPTLTSSVNRLIRDGYDLQVGIPSL